MYMKLHKIVRSICYFTDNPSSKTLDRLNSIAEKLIKNNIVVQTRRICSKKKNIPLLQKVISDKQIYLSIGSVNLKEMHNNIDYFLHAGNVSLNINLTSEKISHQYVDLLFQIIKNKPEKTFLYTFVFNNPHSAPYFPSANYGKTGFSIGLQPIDLSSGCLTIDQWFENMKIVWEEIESLLSDEPDYLGIDSSTAPLLGEEGSLIGFIRRLGVDFSDATLSTIFLQITDFIKRYNPKPVGLCGLMLPCLEDTYLADEYQKGYFSIERNIFLSLQSGLGIDVYPIGIDQNQEKILQILLLLQGLSNKYQKPLSARFVSDGKAKIGEKTDFQNEFLKDVTIRPL